MKKYFLHILWVSLLGVLAVSCSDEQETMNFDSSKAQVVFSVALDTPIAPTRAAGDGNDTWVGDYSSNPGDEYDNHIDMSKFIVKIEHEFGECNVTECNVTDILKWKKVEGENADEYVYQFVGIVEGIHQVTALRNPKIYVYANMGETTPAETFSQTAENIPMWGVKKVEGKVDDYGNTHLTLTPGTRVNMGTVSLLRAMAKLEVKLGGEMPAEYELTSATLNRYNTYGNTHPTLTKGFNGNTESLGLEGVLNENKSPAEDLALVKKGSSYVVYLPEVVNGTTEEDLLKITVQLKEKNGTGTEEGSFFIKDYSDADNPVAIDIIRNHWYQYTIKGFAASEIQVSYNTVPWTNENIYIGGEGFLYLNPDVIEIYNSNIDAEQLKFYSSTPIKSITLKDIYKHERNGSFTEGTEDGVYAYYMDKFGVLTQLSSEEGTDEATVLSKISAATIKVDGKEVLEGGIVINSPFMADKDASETALQSDSHYNTVRYLEFEVENEQGLLATFRVMQYPPVVITNEEGYFSYRDDQKYSDDQEEASHFHNYMGWKSYHCTCLYWYTIWDWSKVPYDDDEESICLDTDIERNYSQAVQLNVAEGVDIVHYGDIGVPHSFIDSRGIKVDYVYGGLHRSNTAPANASFTRHRYYKLSGQQTNGDYKETVLKDGTIQGGYSQKSYGKYYYYFHDRGDRQGLALGPMYDDEVELKDGTKAQFSKLRKQYVWNVQPIFYNRYVSTVYQNDDNAANRKKGQADICSMTHNGDVNIGDEEGFAWGVWGKQAYTNHRMYHVKTTVSSSEYKIGKVDLIDKDGKPTDDVEIGVTENSVRNADLISPSFMVASQLGESDYQAIFNAAKGTTHTVPNVGKFYQFAVEQCREYVETTYKDLNNNYRWDEGEPLTHYKDWRLPTKAEINKIIELQETSRAMDKLLVGQYYFCATGAGENADPTVRDNWVSNEVPGYTSGKTGCYIRCVRDVKPDPDDDEE